MKLEPKGFNMLKNLHLQHQALLGKAAGRGTGESQAQKHRLTWLLFKFPWLKAWEKGPLRKREKEKKKKSRNFKDDVS